jgi:hypothetical protein
MTLGMQIPDAKRKRETVRGTVVDNNDPLRLRRVRVQIPSIYGNAATSDLPWAMVDKISGNQIGNSSTDGTFGVLSIGSAVWVEFQSDDYGNDDHDLPLVTACDLTAAVQKAEELVNYPNRYGFKDKLGNLFYVDRQAQIVQVNLFTNKVTLTVDQNGNVTMEVAGNVNQTIVGNLMQHIEGSAEQTVDGNITINANSNVQATVQGTLNVSAFSDVTASVGGNLMADVLGSTALTGTQAITVNSTTSIALTAPTVSING